MAAGAGLAAVYVLVALATSWLAGHPARTLFDGFAPPPNYDWVNPPPGVARASTAPPAATVEAALSAGGSAAAAAATSDGQATATIEAGSVAARPRTPASVRASTRSIRRRSARCRRVYGPRATPTR